MNEIFMKEALKEAEKALKEDEVPVGCVIVKDGKVIARAHNRKEKKNSALSHAEIECINKAARKTGDWYLKDCELYVTLEPCMMCTGALINSRIERIVYGCEDPKGGALVSNIRLKKVSGLNHYPEITGKVMEEECSKILKDFFKEKRKKQKEERTGR